MSKSKSGACSGVSNASVAEMDDEMQMAHHLEQEDSLNAAATKFFIALLKNEVKMNAIAIIGNRGKAFFTLHLATIKGLDYSMSITRRGKVGIANVYYRILCTNEVSVPFLSTLA
jgi:hypothetical protein